jgi:predicted Zn-dependent peptidase
MEEVIRLAEKYMGHLPRIISRVKRKKFTVYIPQDVTLQRSVKQARCAMGRTAYSLKDEQRGAFYLLNNILGGSGMNSRLNLSLREKHGFVYSIGSHFAPFTDTGLFVISFGTEPSQLSKSIRLVHEQLRKLREEELGTRQLSSAKEQILGQVAMAEESNSSFMMMMARTLLDTGKVPSLEEVFSRIRNTTVEDIIKMSNEMLDEKKMSVLIMEPK